MPICLIGINFNGGNMENIGRSITKVNLMAVFCFMSSCIYAAGSQSLEQDASDLGRAYAGGAITGDNAVIEFDNPAAMTQLKTSAISLVTAVASPHTNFKGSSLNAQGETITAKPEDPLGRDLKSFAGVAFHYVQPIKDKFVFGFGITQPFGGGIKYDTEGIARYFVTNNSMKTYNFNPSLAYVITDKFSVGVGASAQYLRFNVDKKVDPSIVGSSSCGPGYDGNMENNGSDWGYGYNLGLAYVFSDSTQMGLSYRSAVRHRPSGNVRVDYPDALLKAYRDALKNAGFDNGTFSVNLDLPATYMWSLSQKINSNWEAMATIAYTNWSHFSVQTFHYSTQLGDQTFKTKYQDSWRFALGTDYRINEKWLVRFGTSYDTSPENDKVQLASIPDFNRFWLACGANYVFNKSWSLDLAYAHIFLQSGKVIQSGAGAQKLTGFYNDTHADVLGLQLNWKFS